MVEQQLQAKDDQHVEDVLQIQVEELKDVPEALEVFQEDVSRVKEAAWSGEKVEDPDTDDIDLLLMNNYKNYGLKMKNTAYPLEEEEIEDLHDSDLMTKDTDGDDEYEEEDESNLEGDSDGDLDHMTAGKKSKRGWIGRVARIAVPLQFALISLFAVARLFEPQCCDVVNNFSMSFTPHLRYVRGPPPM